MPAQVFGRGMQNQINAELERPLVKRRGKRRIDNRLDPMTTADFTEALEIDDVVVRISRRFAYEHARGRTDRSFYSLIVAGSSHRDFDAITVQHLREKLTSPAIRVVCDNHMRSVRENGKERGCNCGHTAGKQQAILGPFELRQLLLGDTLRWVAITAVLLALDTSLKMVAKLIGICKGVGGGLHDRCRQRIAELRPRLTAMDGDSADASGVLRQGSTPAAPRLGLQWQDSSFVAVLRSAISH